VPLSRQLARVLHGPYWQWTRQVGGKTITRLVSDEQRTTTGKCSTTTASSARPSPNSKRRAGCRAGAWRSMGPVWLLSHQTWFWANVRPLAAQSQEDNDRASMQLTALGAPIGTPL
jgi:hypothetical protein